MKDIHSGQAKNPTTDCERMSWHNVYSRCRSWYSI